jgi:hypothetical protein
MEIITLHEVADILRYEGDGAEKKARKWLYKYGLKQFATGKNIREQFEELLEERGKRCLISENGGSATMSGGRCVWAKKPLSSKNSLLDLTNLKMRESMSVN